MGRFVGGDGRLLVIMDWERLFLDSVFWCVEIWRGMGLLLGFVKVVVMVVILVFVFVMFL